MKNDGLTEDQKYIDEAVKAQLPLVLKLPNPYRSQCLLCLAYEYFILDMEEEAYKLLMKADPEYFKDQLAKDIKEIPNMDIIVKRVAKKLVELGFGSLPV